VKKAVFFSVPFHPDAEVRITDSRFLNRKRERRTIYRAVHSDAKTNDIGKAFPCSVQEIGFQKILLHCLPPFSSSRSYGAVT
jgi:hypothetical protein